MLTQGQTFLSTLYVAFFPLLSSSISFFLYRCPNLISPTSSSKFRAPDFYFLSFHFPVFCIGFSSIHIQIELSGTSKVESAFDRSRAGADRRRQYFFGWDPIRGNVSELEGCIVRDLVACQSRVPGSAGRYHHLALRSPY